MAGLVERVERGLDQLARRMLDTIVEEVPLYSHLPREQLDGEILDVCSRNLQFFFASLDQGGRPAPDALAELKASAARRAEERVPLDAVLRAYHVGTRVAWDALQSSAGADEQDELLALTRPLLAYVQTVTSTVSEAYVEERGTIEGDRREASRGLLEALLAGSPVAEVSERLGEPLPPGYLALALRVGPSSDEIDSEVERAVAGRRKARRVEQCLTDRVGDGVLWRLDATGGIALLPMDPEHARSVAADASDLVEALDKAADAEVWAGLAWREGVEAVPEVVREARDVLRLVRQSGLPAGAYRLDDVLLEHVVSRPGPARGSLLALLEPLDEGPDLVPTLEAWFAADFDRRGAAGRLHIHPNTLDYRLKRVTELTGLDPGTARGVQLLGAALLARRLGEGS